MKNPTNDLTLFDAVEVVRLPNDQKSINAYYSHFANRQISVGDIGVVIGDWPGNKFRVEAVDNTNSIVWQDHFDRDQLKLRAPTDASYSRLRINEHWAWQNAMDGETSLTGTSFRDALAFARKVMCFAKNNVEVLAKRLDDSGYQFVADPLIPPEPDISSKLECLRDRGIFLPIALQAWLIEIGGVDFCGTHPRWAKTGYAGLNHNQNDALWYTDPLCIQFFFESLPPQNEDDTIKMVEIAPDMFHKANVSGAGPIAMHYSKQRFDDLLIGQHGSYTLLSYLRHAFNWGGFPGFSYIPDAPTDMLREWSQGLTQL